MTAEGLTSVPSTIELKGPESELAKYSSIKADVPIEIKKDKNGNEKYQATVSLDTPNFVTANPPQLTVTYTLSSGLVSLELKCPVHVADSSNREYEVIPPELPVTVEVPESLSRDRKYLDKLQAFVTPPTMAIGEEKVLKPRFQKPEGMIIPGSSRHIVTVRYLGDPEEKNL